MEKNTALNISIELAKISLGTPCEKAVITPTATTANNVADFIETLAKRLMEM